MKNNILGYRLPQNSATLSLDKNKNLVENETLSPSNTTKTETNNEVNRVVENDGSKCYLH